MSEHTQEVADDVHEAEFKRFLEAMDLVEKTDSSKLDAEDSKALANVKATILSAMRRGSLVIDQEGRPVFTPQKEDNGAPLVFHEPTGAELMAMDKAKPGAGIERQNKFLAAITRQAPVRFAKMYQRDYTVCQSLIVLFLA